MLNIKSSSRVRLYLLIFDFLCLNLSIFLTFYFDFSGSGKPSSVPVLFFILLFNLSWIVCCSPLRLYQFRFNYLKYLRQCLKAYFLFSFLVVIYFLLLSIPDQRKILVWVILPFLLVFLVGLLMSRLLSLFFIRLMIQSKHLCKSVVIIGNGSLLSRMVSYFIHPYSGFRLIGVFSEESQINNVSYLGNPLDSFDYIKDHKIMEIYVLYSALSEEHLSILARLANLSGSNMRIVGDFHQRFHTYINYQVFGSDLLVMNFRREPLENSINCFYKRSFDLFILALTFILVLWWLFPLIALLIWLDNPGPVLFRQVRTGWNNQNFICYKFRSMVLNDTSNSKEAVRNDKRITRIGKILRKTNMDELPQLINVARGDMSIVGPRPHMLSQTQQFASIIEQYLVRHQIKPGLTGYAQVNGLRGGASLDAMGKRVCYDVWYMEHWSLWLDLKIVLKTALLMISGDKNAY